MPNPQRPYLLYDVTISICSVCLRRVEGKILFQDDRVYLQKWCPQHGKEKVLVSVDVPYYRRSREVFLKPPEEPLRRNTPMRWGCPYDCGICPDHEQHSCVSLVEITDACNLECPICYAASAPGLAHRNLEQITFMLDQIVANEGEPDVVQISGGEPTIHPEFFAVLDAARARPIRYLMVNTNGVRLARDPAFAPRLAAYCPGFELYLQFDSFEKDVHLELRGEDLREVRRRALDRCNEHGIPVTLVCTIKRGKNDRELGRILDFALAEPCVRGVTFQPVQEAGRLGGYDTAVDRLTLSEVRRGILEQSPVFKPDDILPVPCHPDALAMAYALKMPGGGALPLTSLIPLETLLSGADNTIVLARQPAVREQLFKLFSTGTTPQEGAGTLAQLLCCLPRVQTPQDLRYENLFRVVIVEFADAQAFDVRSVQRSCIHIAHPDGRIIPFDTYNLFYRDGRVAKLQEQVAGAW